MLNELKQELKWGKKVYLFELLSILGYMAFLMVGPSVSVFTETALGNITMFGWIIINILVMTIYIVYDFCKVLLKEKKASKTLIRNILIKIMVFILIYSLSLAPFTMMATMMGTTLGLDVGMPLLSLAIGLMIVAYNKKVVNSSKVLTTLGVLWFVTMFTILSMGYPLMFAGLNSLISQEMVVSTIINIAFFGLTLLLFIRLIKKTQDIIKE